MSFPGTYAKYPRSRCKYCGDEIFCYGQRWYHVVDDFEDGQVYCLGETTADSPMADPENTDV